jgi:hypothetical protein
MVHLVASGDRVTMAANVASAAVARRVVRGHAHGSCARRAAYQQRAVRRRCCPAHAAPALLHARALPVQPRLAERAQWEGSSARQ